MTTAGASAGARRVCLRWWWRRADARAAPPRRNEGLGRRLGVRFRHWHVVRHRRWRWWGHDAGFRRRRLRWRGLFGKDLRLECSIAELALSSLFGALRLRRGATTLSDHRFARASLRRLLGSVMARHVGAPAHLGCELVVAGRSEPRAETVCERRHFFIWRVQSHSKERTPRRPARRTSRVHHAREFLLHDISLIVFVALATLQLRCCGSILDLQDSRMGLTTWPSWFPLH